MKKILLSLLLVFSLQATPLPARAGNGMTDIISTMMQMFLWMMSGGSGMSGLSGLNPYSMYSGTNTFGQNPYGLSPYGFNSGANPYMAGGPGGAGRYNSWGSSPYSQYGYGVEPRYYSPYGNTPYNSYYGNNDYNRYGYADPYGPAYDPGRNDLERKKDSPSVIIQPIIVSPGEKSDGTQTPKVEVLPAQPVEPAEAAGPGKYAAVPPPQAGPQYYPNVDNPLIGRWQGVNGELMELGRDSFYLRSQNNELRGTYQLKNGIMKATIPGRNQPVYMQYRLKDGRLAFRSEDGQMMLLRRLYRGRR